MGINFDESYFTDKGYSTYRNFLHFHKRAEWIRDNLSGSILEVGCAYGYLMAELKALGITIVGVDKSAYAASMSLSSVATNIIIEDIRDMELVKNQFDWIISWNVLDCLDDDEHATAVAKVLNTAVDQLHIIQMCDREDNYKDQGYFIRDYNYWRNLLPEAYLVDHRLELVHVPEGKAVLNRIPLCGDERYMSVTD